MAFTADLGNLERRYFILISNFRRVLNVVCFLLGNSPASEFYTQTFRHIKCIPIRL